MTISINIGEQLSEDLIYGGVIGEGANGGKTLVVHQIARQIISNEYRKTTYVNIPLTFYYPLIYSIYHAIRINDHLTIVVESVDSNGKLHYNEVEKGEI